MVLQLFLVWKPLVPMVFQWFSMVANHWSDDGMVTIHRSGLCHSDVLGRISQLWLQSPAFSGLAFGTSSLLLKILGLLTFELSSWTWSTRTKYTKPFFFITSNTSFFYEMAFSCNRTSYICLESSLASSNAYPIWDKIWYLPEFGRRSLLTNIRRERN